MPRIKFQVGNLASAPTQIHFKVVKVSQRGLFEGLIGNFEHCHLFRDPQER